MISLYELTKKIYENTYQTFTPTKTIWQLITDIFVEFSMGLVIDMKSKRSVNVEKGCCLSDLSLNHANHMNNHINYSHIFENIVYVYLRSKNDSVSISSRKFFISISSWTDRRKRYNIESID